ncbi:anti-sigma factor family protein, partial [Arenimonas donghaensis]
MTPDDPLLMAYADGQLQGEQAARVQAAIDADPALAEVVARHRALATRLQQAYAPVLYEPVPDRLQALATAAPVASLAQARGARAARAVRRGPGGWLALAAMLVVGLGVGLLLGRPGAGPVGTGEDGALLAQGGLAEALQTRLASEPAAGVVIGLSFRDDQGQWCRSFHIDDASALAGLACRGADGRWRLPVLATAAPQDGELARASAAIPPA